MTSYTLKDSEREFRAKWIRDAARDLLTAWMTVPLPPGDDLGPGKVEVCWCGASVLWDLYVKERE